MSDEPKFEWIELGDGRSVYRRVTPPAPDRRSAFGCPMVVSDQIEVQSQVDGKVYTSKRALRESYRSKGYIEIGNEKMEPAKRKEPDRKAIRESVGKALNRVGVS